MARKSFQGGVNSLFEGTKESTKKQGEKKTTVREITKTSQAGTKAGETRATFIMNEDQLEKLKAIAYWDRMPIKEVVSQAIDDYLSKKKPELTKAFNAYKNKAKS